MNALATFTLRGPWQAALVVWTATLLPFLSVFSGAALALVTLRQGPRPGLLVIALAGTALGVITFLLYGTVSGAVAVITLYWLPSWLLANVLRYTVSLAKTLQASLVLTAVLFCGCAAYLGDIAAWGQNLLTTVLEPALIQAGAASGPADSAQMRAAMAALEKLLAPLLLGLIFASGLLSVILSLLLGRWQQALLFNPGGFRKEFHELRLGRRSALVALAIGGLALLTQSALLDNIALLVAVIYAVQGIALVHGLVGKAGLAVGWLVGFYLLLLLAQPHMTALLYLASLIDAWADFRSRVRPRAM